MMMKALVSHILAWSRFKKSVGCSFMQTLCCAHIDFPPSLSCFLTPLSCFGHSCAQPQARQTAVTRPTLHLQLKLLPLQMAWQQWTPHAVPAAACAAHAAGGGSRSRQHPCFHAATRAAPTRPRPCTRRHTSTATAPAMRSRTPSAPAWSVAGTSTW